MKFHGLKKAAAYWSSYWALLAVYFVTLFVDKETAKTIAVPVVAAIVTLSGVSQGWNVAQGVNVSKNYNAELAKEGKE